MGKKKNQTENRNPDLKLRDEAEEKLAQSPGVPGEMQEKTLEEVIHELQVHQIELEMQNDELRKAQLALEESRQRYADLYDFAPVGYFTFTPEALIKEVNLTGATLLGVARQKLINRRFRSFVALSDFDLWDHHFWSVLRQGERQSCDLTIRRQDDSTFFAGLESIRVEVSGEAIEVHTVVIDITDRKRAEEGLRASEEHYRILFEEALDGICLADAETGIIIDCNQALTALVGRERAELIGQPQKILHPPQDGQETVSLTFKQHLTDKQGQVLETQVVTRQGDIREVEIKANFLDIRGRKLLQGIFRDITERKRAEEALRKSEEKLSNLFDNAVEGVFQTTPEGRLITANWAFARMFGYESPEEVINSVTDIARQMYAKPDDREKIIDILKETGNLKNYECQMRQKDGRIFWVSVNARFTKTVDNIPCFEGFTIDVTERKQLEEIIRQSEERYRTIIEEIDEGYYETDLAGNFTFVNDSMTRLLQYSREELIGMNYRTYIPREQAKGIYQTFNRTYRTGEITKWYPATNIRKDGTLLFVEDSVSCLRDKEGRTIGFRGVSRDVTERKKAEEKLSQTLENLRKAMGGIIQVISGTVETKDPYTAGHQRRVADLARAIAGEMELAEDQREGLRMAGTIHDLGKISVPAEILSKPTKLSEIEYKLIQAHSQIGYDILKGIDFSWPIADIILQHHERLNGSGYPQGLKGEAISLEAQILMVADVVEAMASYRPYRPALGVDAALEEIEKNKGILYDPEVVEVCLRLFREKGFRFE